MQEMIKQIIREEMYKSYKQYYFIAGLPRSGNSLISAILNQNPQFHSPPNSPVLHMMIQMEQVLAQDSFFNAYPKPAQANLIIGSIINNWYKDTEKSVIFDKNTLWLRHIFYITGYLDQKPKIICPVRNLDEILASFITLFENNKPINENGRLNFIDEQLVRSNVPITNDNRCLALANNGLVGQAYSCLKYAFENGFDDHILLIEYDDLINNTDKVFKDIYDFIEQPYFEHNFTNISTDFDQKDELVYGIKNMHQVRPTIQSQKKSVQGILSENIQTLCKGTEFWRVQSENTQPIEAEVTLNEIDAASDFNLNTNDTKLIY